MGDALPTLAALGNGETLFLSVAAGTPIAAFEDVLGAKTPIIRAMPNTPAAIGRGITAIIGNAHTTAAQLDLAGHLFRTDETIKGQRLPLLVPQQPLEPEVAIRIQLHAIHGLSWISLQVVELSELEFISKNPFEPAVHDNPRKSA